MSEWWTYRPSDFLMFAPSTYWRLFELHNEALWPAPLVLLAFASLWMVLYVTRRSSARRIGCAAAAAAWAFVGWAFLLQRFEPIQWVASHFAAGFGIQALLLAALAWRADPSVTRSGLRRGMGLALLASALWVVPLMAPLSGRPWMQAEWWGLAPDPTAIATLGLLLGLQAKAGADAVLLRAAWVLPVTWCLISAATLATMQSAQAVVPAAAVILAGIAVGRDRERPSVSRPRGPAEHAE